MERVEAFLAELRESLREMREATPERLPRLLTYEAAAEQLSISKKTLTRMIAAGGIAISLMPGTDLKRVPSDEVERIAKSARFSGQPRRRSGGRPKAQKHDPKAEAALLRAKLRGKP